MKNILKKIMVVSAIFSVSVLPVFATEVEPNPTGTETATVTYNSEESVDVKGCAYLVKIPKTIDMGSNKTASYEVGVGGVLTDNVAVTITPDSTFTMTKNDGTETVTATVIQEDVDWTKEEMEGTYTDVDGKISIGPDYAMHSGTISAPDLSTGQWTGSLTFTIKVVNNY